MKMEELPTKCIQPELVEAAFILLPCDWTERTQVIHKAAGRHASGGPAKLVPTITIWLHGVCFVLYT